MGKKEKTKEEEETIVFDDGGGDDDDAAKDGGEAAKPNKLSTLSDDELIAKYRKLQGMNIPEDILRYKMEKEGVSQSVVKAVLLQGGNNSGRRRDNNNNNDSSSLLSDEEEAIASRFRRLLLKMQVPEDIVRYKMSMESIDEKIIIAVLGSPSSVSGQPPMFAAATTTTRNVAMSSRFSSLSRLPANTAGGVGILTEEEEATVQKFKKLIQMNVPEDIIRYKMNKEAIGEKIMTAVFFDEQQQPRYSSSSTTKQQQQQQQEAVVHYLTQDEAALVAKYRKLQGMNMPEDILRYKMEKEGVAHKIAAVVFGEEEIEIVEQPPVLTAEEQAVADKFKKFTNLQLPDDILRYKMEKEGVSERVIAAVLGGGFDPAVAEQQQQQEAQSSSAATSVVLPHLLPDEEAVAVKFRKLLGMFPEDIVRYKMEKEGISARIIASVMGEPLPSAAPPSKKSKKKKKGGGPLTQEEEVIAAKFRKLAKMDLPEDILRYKMEKEGVSERIIKAVLREGDEEEPRPSSPDNNNNSPATVVATVALTAEEEAVAAKFQKLLTKLNLPDDILRYKMEKEGVSERVIAAVLGGGPIAAEPSFSKEEEALIAKFVKLTQMDLPEDIVRYKMEKEGVSETIINAVFPPEAAIAAAVVVPAPDEPQAAAADQCLTIEEEATAAKFRKLLEKNLPQDIVRYKMEKEGVSDRVIAAVMDDDAPPPSEGAPTVPVGTFSPVTAPSGPAAAVVQQ